MHVRCATIKMEDWRKLAQTHGMNNGELPSMVVE